MLTADGSVPVEVARGRTGVVPMLVLSNTPGALQGLALKPLGPNQRLVGTTLSDVGIAALVFPSQEILTVPVDALPGPSLAWESLDAIITDRPIDPAQLPELLARGIAVAIRATAQPDTTWPWKRADDFWVLRPWILGPDSAIGGEVAYLPVQSWRPTLPSSMVRNILITGVLVAVTLLFVLTLPSRASLALMIVLTLLGLARFKSGSAAIPPFTPSAETSSSPAHRFRKSITGST